MICRVGFYVSTAYLEVQGGNKGFVFPVFYWCLRGSGGVYRRIIIGYVWGFRSTLSVSAGRHFFFV